MTPDLPTLRAPSGRDALARETLAALPPDALARWLATRRWFGAKGGAPRRVEIARVVPLPWDDGAWAIAEVVTEGDTGRARWQLPLAARGPGPSAPGPRAEAGSPDPAAPLAILRLDDGADAWLVDATTDPRFLRHLADAFGQSTGDPQRHGTTVTVEGDGWRAETVGHEAFAVPLDTPVRLASGEQSNTSILVGDLAILKLFRRLEAGEHPDVEVTRFLTTEAAFAHTPVLLGVITITHRGAPPTVAGMLQEYLPESVDAWRWTLDRGRGAYAPHADRLGVVTRAMHEAFAGPAAHARAEFAPERADAAEVRRWAERVRTQVADAADLLRQAHERLPPTVRADAERVLGQRDEWLARVDAIADRVGDDAGQLVRHHGDYHLGQVLRTAGGDFMVIDFEGEPSRPLAERRRKQSALRDVAGMLRSFAYAAATLAVEAGVAESERGPWSATWEHEAREAFLRGYHRGPAIGRARAHDGEGFLPRDDDNVMQLLTLFEIEKVFYELAYELNNRPDWSWIPLDGIARMAAR